MARLTDDTRLGLTLDACEAEAAEEMGYFEWVPDA